MDTHTYNIDNKIYQFALHFPYCESTINYYKQAIKAGEKNLKVVLPKIHRVESKVLTILSKGLPIRDDKSQNYLQVATNIMALANDTDMRLFHDTKGAEYSADAETVKTKKAPILTNPKQMGDITVFRHLNSPMYCKPYYQYYSAHNVVMTRIPKGTGTTELEGNNQRAEFERIQTSEDIHMDDAYGTSPYYNDKQLPLQLWNPELFVGLHIVKGEGSVGVQMQFDLEYSYEEIDATDYYWRDSGYTSGGSELYVEPSKLYFFKNAVEGVNADKYGIPCHVQTQRLSVKNTPCKCTILNNADSSLLKEEEPYRMTTDGVLKKSNLLSNACIPCPNPFN